VVEFQRLMAQIDHCYCLEMILVAILIRKVMSAGTGARGPKLLCPEGRLFFLSSVFFLLFVPLFSSLLFFSSSFFLLILHSLLFFFLHSSFLFFPTLLSSFYIHPSCCYILPSFFSKGAPRWGNAVKRSTNVDVIIKPNDQSPKPGADLAFVIGC
jgi:hypothetical protein